MLFLHGFNPDTIDGVVPGGWSIADEMAFYTIFPLLAASVTGWRTALLLLIASILLADAARPIVVDLLAGPDGPTYQIKGFAFLWLPNQMPAFLVGILVYHLSRSLRVPRAAARVGLVCAFLAMGWCTFHSVGIQTYLAFSIAFGAVALYLPRAELPALVNPAIAWIGRISFSAYLWHFALIYLFAALFSWSPLPGVFGYAIAFLSLAGATIALSTLTYRLIELPMIAVGHRLINKMPVFARRSDAAINI
jgi:peptidoglycan/LPS O-acetylase OafA/YrhL